MPEPDRFVAYLPGVDPFLSGTGLKKYGSTGDKYGGTGQKLNSKLGNVRESIFTQHYYFLA